jgi:hypothetical protein
MRPCSLPDIDWAKPSDLLRLLASPRFLKKRSTSLNYGHFIAVRDVINRLVMGPDGELARAPIDENFRQRFLAICVSVGVEYLF